MIAIEDKFERLQKNAFTTCLRTDKHGQIAKLDIGFLDRTKVLCSKFKWFASHAFVFPPIVSRWHRKCIAARHVVSTLDMFVSVALKKNALP